ncbi:MAG: hypothetical protein QOE68_3085 [Thermoanaerobaculia bacterium]|jgi:VWFA-related protein|nr:hypothetical protein [Thermoanaerobaculia bacterium]
MAYALFASILLSVAAHGQGLKEKIEVTLVNIDVTVTTKSHTVRGLTREDFEVLEDGVPQTITNFYAVENTTAPHSGVVAPQAAPVGGEQLRRKVLVVVDYVHTSKINRNRALERLEQFIDERFTTGEYDWSIAIAGMDMRVVLPLTSDKTRIRGALEAMRHDAPWRPSAGQPYVDLDVRFPFSNPEELYKDATYTIISFSAVLDAMRGFGGTEGKKALLLFSNGFGTMIDRLDLATIPGAGSSRKMLTFREELVHEANAENLNVYIIDPQGLDQDHVPLKRELYWLGRETGGDFLAGNHPEASLRLFDELSSNFYSMAYRPRHPEDFKYHRITVRLKRAGSYELKYRGGYGSPPIQEQ